MARNNLGLPTGVEFVGTSIRIRFTWKGAEPPRRCETLSYPQTQKGIAAAASLRAQVVQLIKHGALTDDKYAELFPNSRYAITRKTPSFAEYAQVWLDTREIVDGTRRNYRNVLNLYWMPHLALKPISAITPFELRRIVADTQWTSPTTKRAALVRIRSVMGSAVDDGWLEKNPAKGIDLPRKNKREIDPFTREEAERIIAHLYENLAGRRVEIYAAYMEFAFFTGMRPGEIRALREEEINTTQRIARVCRIVVDGDVAERIKNRKPRNVLLNDRALHALERARAIKRDIKIKTAFMFPPAQGGEWMKDAEGPTGYLKEAIGALGIRPRRLYDTRHTYATLCLMSGMNVAFIANQLGHTVEMLLSTYAEWINSPSDWSELAKLSTAVIGTKLVQAETPQL